MPRRCACDRLIEMVERDPRLIGAGLAARALFLLLMRLAERMGTPGVVRLGDGIETLAELALAVSVREPELETQIETLVARGVLVRDGRGYACPALREAGERAARSRRNGAAGGRPRAGETPAEARARRQGNLMLTLPGGRDVETQETQNETSRARVTSSSHSEKREREEPNARAREVPEFVRIGLAAAEAAGIDPARWMGTCEPAREWLALGLTEEEILGVVRARAPRATGPITGLAYFGPAMREAAERKAARASGTRRRLAEQRWERDVMRWQEDGRLGRMPELAEYLREAAA